MTRDGLIEAVSELGVTHLQTSILGNLDAGKGYDLPKPISLNDQIARKFGWRNNE